MTDHDKRNLGTTAAALSVAAAYYGGNHLGFALTPPSEPISPLWPPNAILLAALLLAPRGRWWAFIVAVLPAHLLVQIPYGVPVVTSLGWFVSNCAEALLGAWCIRKLAKPEQLFSTVSGLMIFIAFGVIGTPLVTSFLDAGVVVGTGRGADFWNLWRARLFSNMLATLLFVPPIVTVALAVEAPFGRVRRGRLLEGAALALGILAVGGVLFGGVNQPAEELPLLIYTLLPMLLWAAIRFGPAGVSCAVLTSAFLLIWNAIHGRGPFTHGDAGTAVSSVQLLLGVLAVPLLSTAVIMQERVRAQALQSAVLASLHDRVAIVDRHGMVIAVNDLWLAFKGSGAAWFASVRRGSDYLDTCRRAALDQPDDVAARALRAIEGVLNGALPRFELEYAWPTPSQVYWFRLSTEPLQRPDGGAVITHTDVTSAKLAQLETIRLRQELAQASRAMTVGELSGALAHELNQPLTAIMANAQAAQRLLSREPADLAEVRDVLGDIVSADRRAGEVIRRVRALMQPADAPAQELDLNVVIREVLDLVPGDLAGRGATVATELAPALPSVSGVRVQLQQVLLNLILNACDAMAATVDGVRRVTIVTARTAEGSARVSIADRGTGIPQEHLERVFEPFFTSRKGRLGLGLSMCRSIVMAHGGRLWAANQAEGGVVVHFDLPAGS